MRVSGLVVTVVMSLLVGWLSRRKGWPFWPSVGLGLMLWPVALPVALWSPRRGPLE